jgi:hypothetical protein
MPQVLIIDKYPIEIQAQDAKSFKNEKGELVEIEAVEARKGYCCICEYDEYRLPLILPKSFDEKKANKGDWMNITCNQLSKLYPFQIKNVNRVIPSEPGKK